MRAGRWALLLAGILLGVLSAGPVPAPAAPLAQATATPTPTNTPTPTPTAPPFLDFGNGYGVQPLPRMNVNCVVDTTVLTGVFFACTSGTPVPTP